MFKFLTILALVGISAAQNPRVALGPSVAISQPQILAVANPQPVRTVIARPITVTRTVSVPPPPPPQPQTIAIAQPAPVTVVRTVQAAPVVTVAAAAPAEEDQRPRAYSFAYDTEHEDGSNQRREESSDANGVVRGSYSYRDADGLFRTVEYVADQDGYRATIKTNEPGMAPAEPANVQLQVDPVPDAVLQKYSQATRVQAAPVAVAVRTVSTPAPIRVQPVTVVQAQPRAAVQAVRIQTVRAQQQQAPQSIRVIPG